MSGQIHIGFPWYRREDYNQLKHIFEDSHTLYRSYEEWRNASEDAVTALVNRDYKVEKVTIEPEPFCAWCAQNGMRPDAIARTAFANAVAQRRHELSV